MQYQDIVEAGRRLAGQVVRTPLVRSETLSRMTGVDLSLKMENLQFTASFKERGALNCLLQLDAAERRRGVIAMSAGNHAQALAYHGQRLGIPTCIVMPRSTPNAKVEQTRVFGAEIHLEGSVFDETLACTEQLAAERSLILIHPYDDLQVMAGQGTIGLEIIEQSDGLDTLVVPVGGGGLISGNAIAIKESRPDVRIVGVQVERFSAAHTAFHKRQPAALANGTATVAEGIAVKSPGEHTLPVIESLVDDMVTVSEEQVEQAVFRLIEIEKTVVEGAGAVGLAAVMADPDAFEDQRTTLVISGGNIDMMILASILQRGMVRTGRFVRLKVEIPDVPGALGELTRLLGEFDSNIIDIAQERTFGGSSVRATLVELSLQMRGEEQVDEVLDGLRSRGYEVALI
ncbi:MAG: threonine ammonia-lyase [Gammaproteobacteria bacterium]|nr:MAG: threonine ammonia-lyase [Gammaproteobacteria bacterium]